MKTYTAQINAHGNVIVCGDTIPRNSYKIVFTGTYQDCLDFKNTEKFTGEYINLFKANN